MEIYLWNSWKLQLPLMIYVTIQQASYNVCCYYNNNMSPRVIVMLDW